MLRLRLIDIKPLEFGGLSYKYKLKCSKISFIRELFKNCTFYNIKLVQINTFDFSIGRYKCYKFNDFESFEKFYGKGKVCSISLFFVDNTDYLDVDEFLTLQEICIDVEKDLVTITCDSLDSCGTLEKWLSSIK